MTVEHWTHRRAEERRTKFEGGEGKGRGAVKRKRIVTVLSRNACPALSFVQLLLGRRR